MSIVHVSQVFVIALTATIKRATFDFNFWSLERERERKRVSPIPRTRWDHSSSSIQFSVGVIDSNTWTWGLDLGNILGGITHSNTILLAMSFFNNWLLGGRN